MTKIYIENTSSSKHTEQIAYYETRRGILMLCDTIIRFFTKYELITDIGLQYDTQDGL